MKHFLEPMTPGLAPRIHGARVFGVRPGSPVHFKIAATGAGPLTYEVTDPPAGLRCDPATGILSGTFADEGTHRLPLTVRNAHGRTERVLRIVVGDTLCLTPPMGWNSWYCWSESVDDAKVRAVAQAMVSKGLADHGWSYVNIDDCWQGERGGPHRAIQGNAKFPDMGALAESVHRLGLRFGLYSTCWMSSYAGFIGGTAPTPDGDYRARYLPPEEQHNPGQYFGRFPNSITHGMAQIGPHWFLDADARQFADWGVDYVKMDWKEWRIANGAVVEERPKSEATLRRLLHDLRAVPRDIVLSLSPLSESGNAANLAKHSNLWRITGDIHDEWAAIRRCFELTDWYRWTRPGAYCDPDMLQVGLFGTPNRQNRVLRPTRLTENEQITQMSLWALVSAPLLLSCDIESLDAFTMALITNDEVIDIDQDALCRAAVRVRGGDDAQVWRKELENGDLAVGIFNLSERPEQIHVAWAELDIQGTWYARDLWNPGEVARSAEGCIRTVASHGCALLRLRRDDAGDDA